MQRASCFTLQPNNPESFSRFARNPYFTKILVFCEGQSAALPRVRSSVFTVLLVAERLRRRHNYVGRLSERNRHLLSQTSFLSGLPKELWLVVCAFFLRADWTVRSPSPGSTTGMR